MKTTIIAAIFIVFVGIATSYAGGFMMLHVGAAPGACAGVIDASAGCPLPMLGM